MVFLFSPVGRTVRDVLKGQCHEIFCFRFFLGIIFPQAPEKNVSIVPKFFETSRRYSQVKVHLRYQGHRWQICTLSCKYFRKWSKKFKIALMGYSGPWGKLIHEKNLKSKISWHCVPLNCLIFCCRLRIWCGSTGRSKTSSRERVSRPSQVPVPIFPTISGLVDWFVYHIFSLKTVFFLTIVLLHTYVKGSLYCFKCFILPSFQMCSICFNSFKRSCSNTVYLPVS